MQELVIVETIPVNCGRTQEAAMRFSAILAIDKGVPSEILAYGHGHLCLADNGKAVLFTPGKMAEPAAEEIFLRLGTTITPDRHSVKL